MAKKTEKTPVKRPTAKSTTQKSPAKQAAAKRTVTAKASDKQSSPRRLKRSSYKSLRLQKRIKHPAKLPSVWKLIKLASLTLWRRKVLFIGITLIYGLLNVVLAQGLSATTNVPALKNILDNLTPQHLNALVSGTTIFVSLITSAGTSPSQIAGAYQAFLALLGSLAIIWALRQVLVGARPRIRDAYYRGMYPLVPFLLVFLVACLQLIPLLVGATLYSIVISRGIAAYFVEKLLWGLLYGLLSLLTFYLLSSSIFALYIVTLPDMTPMRALRSARELVRHRRWTVVRKILALPVILVLIAAVLMLPIIILLTPLAQYVFFILTMLALLAIHTYMYTLYRELLND